MSFYFENSVVAEVLSKSKEEQLDWCVIELRHTISVFKQVLVDFKAYLSKDMPYKRLFEVALAFFKLGRAGRIYEVLNKEDFDILYKRVLPDLKRIIKNTPPRKTGLPD